MAAKIEQNTLRPILASNGQKEAGDETNEPGEAYNAF
jgi:hypothetical protein